MTGCCYASRTKVGATCHRFRIKGLRHASADHPLQHQGLPARLRGALRTACRTALELVQDRHSPQQELQELKLFLLAPRMLLYRANREPRIPPNELDRKCEAFNLDGSCSSSLIELPGEAHVRAAEPETALHELLADARWLEGPAASRMPRRA